jgi:hypothetical protein
MAAVAGPTQEATTVLTPVPMDLPPSMPIENTSQQFLDAIVRASNNVEEDAGD